MNGRLRAALSLLMAGVCLLSPLTAPGAPGKKRPPKMSPDHPHPRTAPISWGTPAHGLRLGLAVTGATAELHLQNVGGTPLTVFSHVAAAGEIHLDWYSLELRDRAGKTRRLRLLDDRNRSAVVDAHLDPGGTFHHPVDVAAWAARGGGQPLAPGVYAVTAVYAVEPAPDHWSGTLRAGPVSLTVRAK